jgi:hypothetical protein
VQPVWEQRNNPEGRLPYANAEKWRKFPDAFIYVSKAIYLYEVKPNSPKLNSTTTKNSTNSPIGNKVTI